MNALKFSIYFTIFFSLNTHGQVLPDILLPVSSEEQNIISNKQNPTEIKKMLRIRRSKFIDMYHEEFVKNNQIIESDSGFVSIQIFELMRDVLKRNVDVSISKMTDISEVEIGSRSIKMKDLADSSYTLAFKLYSSLKVENKINANTNNNKVNNKKSEISFGNFFSGSLPGRYYLNLISMILNVLFVGFYIFKYL